MMGRGYEAAGAVGSLVLLVAFGCGTTVTFDPGGVGGAGAEGGSDLPGAGGTTISSGQVTGQTSVQTTGVGAGTTTVSGAGGASVTVSTGATTVTTVTVTTVGAGGAGTTSVTTTGMNPTSATVGVGGGGGAPQCPHGVCTEGPPLDPGCGMCEAVVCGQDPFCCQAFWDGLCVQEANMLCNSNCPSCPHDICSTGQPLSPGCDPCAAQICQQDPTCCSQAWDGGCVQLVLSVCNQGC